MHLDEIKQTFITESSEILQKMESTLLFLEVNPATEELVNELFRGFHTIKGSAGIFGFEHIVKFTHVVENYMDLVRNGVYNLERHSVALLLECRDLISEMIEYVANEIEPDETLKETQVVLLERLTRLFEKKEESELPAKEPEPNPNTSLEDFGFVIFDDPEPIQEEEFSQSEVGSALSPGATYERGTWHISIRFLPDTLRNGFEPLAILKYMSEITTLLHVLPIHQSLPPLQDLQAEDCFMGFEVELASGTTEEKIREAFEFVEEDCKYYILPPNRQRQDYLSLLHFFSKEKIFLIRALKYMGNLSLEEKKHYSKQRASLKEQHGSEQAVHTKDMSGETTELPFAKDQSQSDREAVIKEEKLLETKKSKKKPAGLRSKNIRVDAKKLDLLINLIGELVITGANIHQLTSKQKDANLLESSDHLSHLISEIRETTLKLRMVPVGEMLDRFHRVVRDIGIELGKDIELHISGGETELDKIVMEKINDPLMHIVRNAIDHGIETREERIASNKDAVGKLSIHAFHETGYIVIEVNDDGRGLDKDKIWQRALQRELVHPDQQWTEQQIFQLVFSPGFSTAEKVTNLSGRGVGMDVAKKNIESLRGSIVLESQRGVGTTFRVRLPLTLAIIDGFLVNIGKSHYIVPLDVVVECIEWKDSYRLSNNQDYINVRGEILPFIRVQEMFSHSKSKVKRKNILVILFAGKKIGLLVDSLLGEIQTVIKPLGKVFQNLKGISGSTILGNGDIALILDIVSLVQRVVAMEARENLLTSTSSKIEENSFAR
ncbi:MAG: chemotaxis protein CheA [Spirochaetota bacterium]